MRTVLHFMMAFGIYAVANAQAPEWDLAKSGGGIADEWANDIATDAAGNIYVTGFYQSDQLTLGSTTLVQTNGGAIDFLLVKFDPAGDVLWARSASGAHQDEGTHVCVDVNGNVYVSGYTYSSSITFGTTVLQKPVGEGAMFVVKYDASGNLLWARIQAMDDLGIFTPIAVDAQENVYAFGTFYRDSLPIGSTTLYSSDGLASDVFMVKYDVSGNIVWAHSLGAEGYESISDLGIDGSGNLYCAGSFQSDTLILGNDTLVNNAGNNIFIAKYDNAGNVIWARDAEPSSYAWIGSICTDVSGNLFVAGGIDGVSLTLDATTLYATGGGSFVAKMDASGNFLWIEQVTEMDKISTDASGNLYGAGEFVTPTLSFGSITLTNSGLKNLFVVKYDAAGNVQWAQSDGGPAYSYLGNIHCDAAGHVYMTGSFMFDTLSLEPHQVISNGAFDFFVARLDAWPLGITEQKLVNEGGIRFFPNPVSTSVSIETADPLKNATLTLYNTAGTSVQEIRGLCGNRHLLQVEHLPGGVYFMKVVQNNTVIAQEKCVITRY